MCGRITIVTIEELGDIIESIAKREEPRLSSVATPRAQARPGSEVRAIGMRDARLEIMMATWGIEAPWNGKLVYNTRLESALGGSGMWAGPIRDGRCILPAATFFEPHASETVPSPKTGRPIKRPYEFEMGNGAPVLIASVTDGTRLSVVTTEPNSSVKPIHPRMPLALRFEEVPIWLEGGLSDIAELADRSALDLAVQPEQLGAPAGAPDSRPPSGSSSGSSQLSLF